MCGFGVIHPLPGIWDALRLNTAITLPVGVEAYGAYALGAWLTPGTQPIRHRGGLSPARAPRRRALEETNIAGADPGWPDPA